MEAIVFAIALVFSLSLMIWRETLQQRGHESREQSYLKMIRDLQNRLTAKDIQGLQVLQQLQTEAEKPASPFGSMPLNDEEEAKLEEIKNSLERRSLAGQI